MNISIFFIYSMLNTRVKNFRLQFNLNHPQLRHVENVAKTLMHVLFSRRSMDIILCLEISFYALETKIHVSTQSFTTSILEVCQKIRFDFNPILASVECRICDRRSALLWMSDFRYSIGRTSTVGLKSNRIFLHISSSYIF